MTKDEALRMALEALETNNKAWKNLADSGDAGFWEAEEQPFYEIAVKAITAIKEALQSPQDVSEDTNNEQVEPVAWMIWLEGNAGMFSIKREAQIEFARRNEAYPDEGRKLIPLFTHPPVPTAQQCTYPKCDYPCMNLPDCKEPEQRSVSEQQEPVAWMRYDEMKAMVSDEKRAWILCGRSELIEDYNKPLYTTPPQRKPLTDEEIQKCYETTGHYQTLRPQDRFAVFALARAIEAAHGIIKE